MPGPTASVVTEGLIEYAATRIAFSVRKYTLKREISIILYGEKQRVVNRMIGGVETPVKIDTGEPVKLVEISGFEKICHKARELLRMRAATNSSEARNDSIGFYEGMISDPTVSDQMKIKARIALDKIMFVADHNGFSTPIPIVGTISHQLDLSSLTKEEKIALLKMKRASNNRQQG